jgi:hypothetical protein
MRYIRVFGREKLSPSVVIYRVYHDYHMSANFDQPSVGRKPIYRNRTYVGFPRATRENNVHEDLRGAPLLGVVVDLMFGWLFDISWPVVF